MGTNVEFHGAYGSKSGAVKKARELERKYGSGWIKTVRMNGKARYVAMTKAVPF